MFDVVGVFRHAAAEGEREATDCEVAAAALLADEDALFQPVSCVDGLVRNVVRAANQWVAKRSIAGSARGVPAAVTMAVPPRGLKTVPRQPPDCAGFASEARVVSSSNWT